MKNFNLLIVALFCLNSACKNHEQKKSVEEKTDFSPQEKKDFFPVEDYMKSEISYVDSLPLKMVKFVTVDKKTDSMLIKLEEFNALAKEFLPVELKDSAFRENFDESSFLDQTTQSLTFTYSTKNSKSLLQRVDVLATQGPGFDKVKSIYMETIDNRNDTLVTKKMYWRTRKSFEIITILQSNNQRALSNQLKVVWDDSE